MKDQTLALFVSACHVINNQIRRVAWQLAKVESTIRYEYL